MQLKYFGTTLYATHVSTITFLEEKITHGPVSVECNIYFFLSVHIVSKNVTGIQIITVCFHCDATRFEITAFVKNQHRH